MVRLLVSAVLACLALVGAVGCSKDPEVAKREYLTSGDQYVQQKKYAEAVVEYRNAIQQDPRFGQARYKLAETYMQLNQPAEAFREYIRAADLMPENVEAQVKAARMLLAGGRFLDAQSRAEKALAADPKNIDAQLVKAAALAGMKKFDDAVSQVEQAIQAEPLRVGSHLDLGMLEAVRGNKQAAEDAFKRAVDADPKSVTAKLALANFYWMSNRRDEAKALLEQLHGADATNVQVNRALTAFYLGTGQVAAAEAPLKAIVEATKEDSARVALAEYYLSSGRRDEARALLRSVGSGTGQSASMAMTRLAALAVLEGRSAEAYKLIDEAIQKEPKNQFAMLARAEMQLQDRKLDESLKTAKEAIAVLPTPNPIAQMVLGRIHAARSEYSEAVAAFNEAIRLNPRLPQAHLQLARAHLATRRTDQALAAAQEALKLQPTNPDAHLLVARAALAKGDVATAEEPMRVLAAAQPKSALVQSQIGVLHLLKKNPREARSAFERALQIDPSHPDALSALAALDIQTGSGAAARQRIEARMKAEPKNATLRVLAGRTYLSLRDMPAAERVLREAIELDSSNLLAYGLLGQVYGAQNKLDQARAEFEQVAAKLPKAVGPATMVGMIHELQNHTAEARRWYEKAIAIDPNAAVAANNLAWLTAQDEGGNLDLALQLAQTAKSRLPDRPEVDDTLGWIYHKKGLTTLAITSFQSSVDKDAKNPLYHYHLGLAYAKNGEKEKARESLKQALSLNPKFQGAEDAQKTLGTL